MDNKVFDTYTPQRGYIQKNSFNEASNTFLLKGYMQWTHIGTSSTITHRIYISTKVLLS